MSGWIIVFSIFLSISLFLSLISVSLNQTVFNNDFYVQFLESQNFYTDLPGLISETLVAENQQAITSSPLSWLSAEQLDEFIRALLPEAWIREQTNLFLNSVLSFINLQTDNLQVSLDMQVVKDNLVGDVGKQAVMSLITGLPDCTSDQLNLLVTAVQTGQGGFELCNPPVAELPLVNLILDPILKVIAGSIPQYLVIPSGEQAQYVRQLADSPTFQIYRIARAGLNILPWVCLCFILLIVVISWRSFMGMMTGLSFPLIMAGLAGAIPGAWMFLQGQMLTATWMNSAGISTGTSISNLLAALLQQMIQTSGRLLLVLSLGALFIGLIFLALRAAAKK